MRLQLFPQHTPRLDWELLQPPYSTYFRELYNSSPNIHGALHPTPAYDRHAAHAQGKKAMKKEKAMKKKDAMKNSKAMKKMKKMPTMKKVMKKTKKKGMK